MSCVLWFGDERRYYTTHNRLYLYEASCGLVMKEDITQPAIPPAAIAGSCGLVMKEDITQQASHGVFR